MELREMRDNDPKMMSKLPHIISSGIAAGIAG